MSPIAHYLNLAGFENHRDGLSLSLSLSLSLFIIPAGSRMPPIYAKRAPPHWSIADSGRQSLSISQQAPRCLPYVLDRLKESHPPITSIAPPYPWQVPVPFLLLNDPPNMWLSALWIEAQLQ